MNEIEVTALNTQFSGFVILLNSCMRISILILCFDYFKKRFDKSKHFIYPLLSCMVFVLYMALLTGTARWVILISAISGVYVLVWYYPKYRKFIKGSILITLVLSIISITIYKFFRITTQNEWQLSLLIEELLKQFGVYFSGARNVGQAIEMKASFGNSISANTLINDFVGSIPGVSSYINQADRINGYFNFYVYGVTRFTSQIIPMIGVGYSYFGFIGSPLFTTLSIYLAIRFGYFAFIEERGEFKYLYSYAAIWLALCMGFNTQIIFGWFINVYLPMYLLFRVNRQIVLFKKI